VSGSELILRPNVITAKDIEDTVVWTVTPYNLVETYGRFGRNRCLDVRQSRSFQAWDVDTVSPSATSPTFRGT
jgi:hypothetical protein